LDHVTGLWDGRRAPQDQWMLSPGPARDFTQNRTRMTQSPCRASLPQANTLNPQPKNLSDNLLSHEGNPRSRTALNHTPASNRVKSPFKLTRNQPST